LTFLNFDVNFLKTGEIVKGGMTMFNAIIIICVLALIGYVSFRRGQKIYKSAVECHKQIELAKNSSCGIPELVAAINNKIKEMAEKDPTKTTFICIGCKEKYMAKDLSDLYVCPLCGSVQNDCEIE